jgi:hypothetical protein
MPPSCSGLPPVAFEFSVPSQAHDRVQLRVDATPAPMTTPKRRQATGFFSKIASVMAPLRPALWQVMARRERAAAGRSGSNRRLFQERRPVPSVHGMAHAQTGLAPTRTVFVLISIGGATNSPRRSLPCVGYLVQHVLHARGLRGALDIAFRLQAVVALVGEISGDGAGFFLQTSEEGDFRRCHRGPPLPGPPQRHQTVAF